MGENDEEPRRQRGEGRLFETVRGRKWGAAYRVFAGTVWVGIVSVWAYRGRHMPPAGVEDDGSRRWVWAGMLAAEVWFGCYWLLTQATRWNLLHRIPFPRRLSQRYHGELPGVDIFVCTADPTIEPPIMVINTVLSAMAYDYPTEKLSVYLSDDGGSAVTLYALLETAIFSKHWLPYCRKCNVQDRSPAAYFGSSVSPQLHLADNDDLAACFASVKKLYEEMEDRIESAAKLGRITEKARSRHESFCQWESFSSKQDHDTILHILIDGGSPGTADCEGCPMPTLVYLAREKRPSHPHHFKAGALNALIRVSANISNGPIILTLDCDMYSHNPHSVRDALCFFMDEEKGHEVAFVQFPQNFNNITPNDLYGNSLRVMKMEFRGLDGAGGPLYVGTGCFHRRDALCGMTFSKGLKTEWTSNIQVRENDCAEELQERVKVLANCAYEEGSEWGEEVGLKYGCQVEDVITGLFIQFQGWRSVYYDPEEEGFLGIAPTTLLQTLVQHKRWAEGDLQILLSKYSPLWYGHGQISPLLRMGYCAYCFWAPSCFATLYYCIIPPLCLLQGIPLFPQVWSPWFLPFAYVMSARIVGSLVEYLWSGGTALGWWNEQRMWLYKRQTSYLFACISAGLKQAGLSGSSFEVTSKVANEDVSRRYAQELMEFGEASPMFTVLSTVALLNLFCLAGWVIKGAAMGGGVVAVALQATLCLLLVLINLPLYQGLFFRQDDGRIPASVAAKSIGVVLVCTAVLTRTLTPLPNK